MSKYQYAFIIRRLGLYIIASLLYTIGICSKNPSSSKNTFDAFEKAFDQAIKKNNIAKIKRLLASEDNAFYSKSQNKKYVSFGSDIHDLADVFGEFYYEEQRRENKKDPRLPRDKQKFITDRRRERAIHFARNQGLHKKTFG